MNWIWRIKQNFTSTWVSVIFHRYVDRVLVTLEDEAGQIWVMLYLACDNVDGWLALSSTFWKNHVPVIGLWSTQRNNYSSLIKCFSAHSTIGDTLHKSEWMTMQNVQVQCSYLYMCHCMRTGSCSTTHLEQRDKPDETGFTDDYWKVFRSVTWR